MKLTRRQLRALAMIARGGQIRRISDSCFAVNSQSEGRRHLVSWHDGGWKCDCPDFLQGNVCKHVETLRWVFFLPLMLSTNSGVVEGSDTESRHSSRPFVSHNGRAVDIRRLVELYRVTLSRMGDIDLPAPRPHPKMSVQ